VRGPRSRQQLGDAWRNASLHFLRRGTNNGDDRRGLFGSTNHCLAVLLNLVWPCILLLLGQIPRLPTTPPLQAQPARGLVPAV
jgi:hypothetical protein